MTVTCNFTGSPETWTEEQLDNWLKEEECFAGCPVQPDSSIDKKSFAKFYFQSPERWKAAFDLIKNTDFSKVEPGRYEIDGKNLFYVVDRYETRDRAVVKPEAHRKYIDIQVVLEGEELMGLTGLEQAEVTVPYNPEKDVEFFTSDNLVYHQATPASYFVFFPEDVHQPTVKIAESVPVKKLVVKLGI
ncbi:MAG TPA: YhcH/YjgK/YiaL family protein [Prolixibacteraceae bacterium]|nr:YhcH/YjgK/YiaL family protein [Prolixibacteraceae bacterium]